MESALKQSTLNDFHVNDGTKTKSSLGVLADQLKRGVEIRFIHAIAPVRHTATIYSLGKAANR